MRITKVNKCRWTGGILAAAAIIGLMDGVGSKNVDSDMFTGTILCGALAAWQLIETGESSK